VVYVVHACDLIRSTLNLKNTVIVYGYLVVDDMGENTSDCLHF